MRVWLALLLLAPLASAAPAQVLVEDPANDNGASPAGTDILSMLVQADGQWVNLTLRLDAFPIAQTPYQLDVMPAGWQVYAFCEVRPVEGPLAEPSTCDGSRMERRPETAPGPAVVQAVSFRVELTLLPEEDGFRVAMPYAAFVNATGTPIEVLRATAGNGVTATDTFVYPDRADIARLETEWWLPPPATIETAPTNIETTTQPAKESPGLTFGLLFLALVLSMHRRR